jgi:hypothetical protein
MILKPALKLHERHIPQQYIEEELKLKIKPL